MNIATEFVSEAVGQSGAELAWGRLKYCIWVTRNQPQSTCTVCVRAVKNAKRRCGSFLVLSPKHRQFWMSLFRAGVRMYLALSGGWAQACGTEHTRTNRSWSRWCRGDERSWRRKTLYREYKCASVCQLLNGVTMSALVVLFCLVYLSLDALVAVMGPFTMHSYVPNFGKIMPQKSS